MIKDELINSNSYYGISERLKTGFEWLKNIDLNNINDGRYEIDGDKIYANIQTYTTKDNAKYEAHRNYIDIQYMIKGIERVGVCSKEICTDFTEYDSDKDIEFMESTEPDSWQTLGEGEFLVLFPQDAHKPSIKINNNQSVKKAVVKVSIK